MGDRLFSPRDFRIFEIPDFAGRMAAIAGEVRPKLTRVGEVLSPDISRLVGAPVFAHVAKHARRTVNPPEDTWVAFGPDRRGYKKDVHFKVAISRNCIRLLFEVGPEYQNKRGWASRWERRPGDLLALLKRARGIGWFKDEHDEDPAAEVKDLGPEQIRNILQELSRKREGQLVFGRRLSQAGGSAMTLEAFRKEALGTFRGLAPVYRRR
ncbi:MAG: DUF1054 family protein [Candidatus Methylomirabilales bacterium]